jgi:hypothetical protein
MNAFKSKPGFVQLLPKDLSERAETVAPSEISGRIATILAELPAPARPGLSENAYWALQVQAAQAQLQAYPIQQQLQPQFYGGFGSILQGF